MAFSCLRVTTTKPDTKVNMTRLCYSSADGVPGSQMAGVMVLTGRSKDTIVLSSGENIEPSSIEDAAVCSPLIKFCVLLGQDRRSLGALVVPDPEAWEELEKEKGVLLVTTLVSLLL